MTKKVVPESLLNLAGFAVCVGVLSAILSENALIYTLNAVMLLGTIPGLIYLGFSLGSVLSRMLLFGGLGFGLATEAGSAAAITFVVTHKWLLLMWVGITFSTVIGTALKELRAGRMSAEAKEKVALAVNNAWERIYSNVFYFAASIFILGLAQWLQPLAPQLWEVHTASSWWDSAVRVLLATALSGSIVGTFGLHLTALFVFIDSAFLVLKALYSAMLKKSVKKGSEPGETRRKIRWAFVFDFLFPPAFFAFVLVLVPAFASLVTFTLRENRGAFAFFAVAIGFYQGLTYSRNPMAEESAKAEKPLHTTLVEVFFSAILWLSTYALYGYITYMWPHAEEAQYFLTAIVDGHESLNYVMLTVARPYAYMGIHAYTLVQWTLTVLPFVAILYGVYLLGGIWENRRHFFGEEDQGVQVV